MAQPAPTPAPSASALTSRAVSTHQGHTGDALLSPLVREASGGTCVSLRGGINRHLAHYHVKREDRSYGDCIEWA